MHRARGGRGAAEISAEMATTHPTSRVGLSSCAEHLPRRPNPLSSLGPPTPAARHRARALLPRRPRVRAARLPQPPSRAPPLARARVRELERRPLLAPELRRLRSPSPERRADPAAASPLPPCPPPPLCGSVMASVSGQRLACCGIRRPVRRPALACYAHTRGPPPRGGRPRAARSARPCGRQRPGPPRRPRSRTRRRDHSPSSRPPRSGPRRTWTLATGRARRARSRCPP